MSDTFLYRQNILTGKKNARNISLAVYLLARDCQKYLPKTLRRLEHVSSYFKHAEFFIAENDSIDATADILLRWCQKDAARRHRVDVRAYVAQRMPSVFDSSAQSDVQSNAQSDAQGSAQGNIQSNLFARENDASLEHAHMQRRTMRIAAVRDSALNAIKKSDKEFDYVLMLDADVISFSVRGLISCFSDYLPPWDVLTANGRLFYFYMAKNILPFIRDIYYDTFAVSRIHEEVRPFDRHIELGRELSLLRKYSMLFPVHSAFGGMGLYKYQAVKDAEYFAAAEEDRFQFCEHVSFHRKLYSAGFRNVFINPAMLLYYNGIARSFVSGFAKHFFGEAVYKIRKGVLSKQKLHTRI